MYSNAIVGLRQRCGLLPNHCSNSFVILPVRRQRYNVYARAVIIVSPTYEGIKRYRDPPVCLSQP